jgi:hypothetical protein
MAFPATSNINYYKGDTLDFKIYPKQSDGTAFPLGDYDSATFLIAPQRGTPSTSTDKRTGIATIYATNVECRIDANTNLEANTVYVYDVEIKKIDGESTEVHTLLTGTISVTDEVVTT